MEYADFGATRETGYTANGIRVVVYTIPNRPVAMTAVFNAGYRYDPAGFESLAHLTEHMIVAGTRDLPSKDRLAAYIEQVGGNISAHTDPSTLMVRLAIGGATHFGSAMHLLNQVLTQSRFNEGTFEKERQSVLQELAVLKMSDSRLVDELFAVQLFSQTELNNNLIEQESTINAITIDDVRRFAADQLVGGNMAIVVAGGITFDKVIALFDQIFELELGKGLLITPPTVTFQPPAERIITRAHPSSEQTWLTYGFAGYGLAHPDTAALDVLIKILGGGRSGTLTRRLRYENGLVYSVSNESRKDLGFGLWGISTATHSTNLKRVIELVNEEWRRAVNDGITASELIQAKAAIVNSAPLRMDAVRNFANFHEWPDLFDLSKATRLPGWLNAINDVTLNDIARVAQDVFRPGTSVLALCGSIPEVEGLVLY